MRNRATRCTAVTHQAAGFTSPCSQDATADGLCYYHGKMARGLLDPTDDYTRDPGNLIVAVSRKHSMSDILVWKRPIHRVGKPTRAPKLDYDMLSLANDVV